MMDIEKFGELERILGDYARDSSIVGRAVNPEPYAHQICQQFEPKVDEKYEAYMADRSEPKSDRLLTDMKIAEVAVVCWPALEGHEQESFRLVAKAQLAKAEADWKIAVKIAGDQGYEAGIGEGERRERERIISKLWEYKAESLAPTDARVSDCAQYLRRALVKGGNTYGTLFYVPHSVLQALKEGKEVSKP